LILQHGYEAIYNIMKKHNKLEFMPMNGTFEKRVDQDENNDDEDGWEWTLTTKRRKVNS
jgi:hypothetical protein